MTSPSERPLEAAAAVVQSSVDGLLAFDDQCRYTLWNAAMERYAGVPAAEVLGRRAFDCFPELLKIGVDRLFYRALAGETTVVENYEVVQDGSKRYFDRHYAPLRDRGGVVVGGVGVVRDVTARRQAEEALREQGELFRAVVETASDAVAIVDARGLAVYTNPALEKALGYARGELVGRPVLDFVHPDDMALASRGLTHVVSELGATVAVEGRWRAKDGRWRTLDGHSRSFVDRDGGLRVVLHARDVTDARRAQAELARQDEALREAQERLRASQKMEAIGRLAGGVAHDFNNLLTVILSCTDLLARSSAGAGPRSDRSARGADGFPPAAGYLGEISAAAERGAALTRQLLTFSRKQPMQARVVDLNAVVLDVQTMLKRLIGEHISLVTEIGTGARHVRVDPGQIEQVLLNLVLNARDAVGEKGGRILLSTKRVDAQESDGASALRAARSTPEGSIPPGGYVALRVEDDGAGMSAEVQAHLFEPFFTTKPRGQGTGLGLATVYGIVKQSGGHVTVRSAPGEGTSFVVLFPTVDDTPDAISSTLAAARPVGDETILLVEDEAPLRRLIREVLTDSGYAVLEACDGDEALRTIAARARDDAPIDLVLSDVVMPGMSGRQLATSVRGKWPRARVLLMSGYDEDAAAPGEATSSAHLATHEPILGKPFTASALARRVREVLDGAEGA